MREFSIVRPEFWTGRTGRELRQHPAEVRELAFYLFTCPNHDVYGLFYKPLDTMKLETGRGDKAIRSALAALEGLDYCAYDPINEWVWVKEMAAIQLQLPLKGVDYRVKAANKWYQAMARNAHLGPFFDRYCDDLCLMPPKRSWEQTSQGAVDRGASDKPLISIPSSSTLIVPEAREVQTERFDRFWTVYPKKVGKKAARYEWDKLKPTDELTDVIVAAVERHRRSHRWLRDNGQAIPDPERYLKNERWNDNYEAGPSVSKQTMKNVEGPLGSFLDGLS